MRRVSLFSTLVACAVAFPFHVTLGNSDKKAVTSVEAESFVEQQFDDFFVDCQAFVDSFKDDFLYCDGAPCTGSKPKLLEACTATLGSPNTVWELRVLPSSTQENNADMFVPDYNEITAVGQQTVWLPLDPTQPPIPLCFDFAISESLTKNNDGEVKSTRWEGFYTVTPQGFGFPTECDTP